MTDSEEKRLDDYNIDIKFLKDKYGFDESVCIKLVKDILEGNFNSKKKQVALIAEISDG